MTNKAPTSTRNYATKQIFFEVLTNFHLTDLLSDQIKFKIMFLLSNPTTGMFLSLNIINELLNEKALWNLSLFISCYSNTQEAKQLQNTPKKHDLNS